MGQAKTPHSLRSDAAIDAINNKNEDGSGCKVTAVAGMIAVASFSGAEAQQCRTDITSACVSTMPSAATISPVRASAPMLPAGDLVLCPASSLHLATPVTSGMRVASFFWLQSMVRDAHARSTIFDLDSAIQSLV
jgi:hypothetical protein